MGDFSDFCERFGRRVRDLRRRKGLTQEQMQDHGFSLRHFQRIEAGQSVTLRTVWKLAVALDVEPRSLLPAGPVARPKAPLKRTPRTRR